jgi:AcrR family transcriptional regulator
MILPGMHATASATTGGEVARKRRPRTGQIRTTRTRIVSGAARCLASSGFTGATTAAIASSAGVAEATVFRHFPRKCDVIAAAAEHLLSELTTIFLGNSRRPARLEKRISAAVRALWLAFWNSRMRALFDVYVAARTDRDLDAALRPVVAAHREGILRHAREIFPEVAKHHDFETVIDTIVYSMQGMVLSMFGTRDDGTPGRTFERVARREFERLTMEMK